MHSEKSFKVTNYINPVCLILLAFISIAAGYHKQPHAVQKNKEKEHSFAQELRPFYDIASLPDYLDNTICGQVSSWDTTGGNDDGFSVKYSFIKRNSDSSLVIFDMKGSGVINRIWTPTPTADTLDFYIDNLNHPCFSISYVDLFSGKRYPFVAPLCGNQLGDIIAISQFLSGKVAGLFHGGRKSSFIRFNTECTIRDLLSGVLIPS